MKNSIYNWHGLVVKLLYHNRYNNFFSIKRENFIKVSLDLEIGDIYIVK